LTFISIARTPLAPGVSPARIHYRDFGSGSPIVVLHSGWGYDPYPFDRQIAALAPRHRIVIPDRSGYGGSPSIDILPPDFHHRAVEETLAVADGLKLQRPVVWGHSDGAVIALLLALAAPGRIAGAIVEAPHFFRRKPKSRRFFELVIANPASTPVMRLHARTWLQIGENAASGSDDLYGGRLSELRVPLAVIRGDRDPRTEPGEVDMLTAASGVRPDVLTLPAGGHSPHSEPATADEVTRFVRRFLDSLARPR
jgi:pimeloyl-ACP methyl ester carboxylesterase